MSEVGVTESKITEAIIEEFFSQIKRCLRSDAIIVGGGPSGLMAASELAERGAKVVIIERNNYLGGGFWIGGYLMNVLTFREPGNEILEEIGVPYRETLPGVYTASGPLTCSKLIARVCEKEVTVLNMTEFEDVVIRDGRVCGVVINWTPVSALPRAITCVDPVSLESRVVIDASGHDAVVARKVHERGLIEVKGVGSMNLSESEDDVVRCTGEVYPGLITVGMATSAVFGLPRMGPTFTAILLSGKKGGELASQIIKKLPVPAES